MVLGFMGLGPLELLIVVGVIALIIFFVVSQRPQMVSCVKCSTLTGRGGFSVGQKLCCVIFFPIGLLALLGGRKPTVCSSCGHTWIT
jgi:hypothetical protein